MKLICEVEDCGEELSEGTGSKGGPKICPRHRSRLYYAKGHGGVPWLRQRHKQLQGWIVDNEALTPHVASMIKRAQNALSEAAARARVALARPKKNRQASNHVH